MPLRPIFYDTETTGVKPHLDKVIEIGAYDPVRDKTYCKLINPEMPIPEISTSICNITDDMVKDAPTFEVIGKEFLEFCSGDTVLIAHNNDSFDKLFLEAEYKRAGLDLPELKYIDSLKWARKYRPDLPRHALQYLREIYKIESNQAHRALDDVMVLYKIFTKMTDDLSMENILDLLNKAKSDTVHVMPFGKFQGKKLSDVPSSYLSWLKKNDVLDKPGNEMLKTSLEKLNLI